MPPSSMLIIWLPLSSCWGRESEIASRNELAAQIERRFHELGYGQFDGRDVGMGSMNLYFCPIKDYAWDNAIRLVVETLHSTGLFEGALVVRCDFALADSGEYEPVEKVVWPPGYQGERPW
jgi:hypothetical protein